MGGVSEGVFSPSGRLKMSNICQPDENRSKISWKGPLHFRNNCCVPGGKRGGN